MKYSTVRERVKLTILSLCLTTISCANGPIKVYVPEIEEVINEVTNEVTTQVVAIRRKGNTVQERMYRDRFACHIFNDGTKQCLYVLISLEDLKTLKQCENDSGDE